jgi:hypothetical protein
MIQARVISFLLTFHGLTSLGQGTDTLIVNASKTELRQAYEQAFKFQSSLLSGKAYAAYEPVFEEHPYLANDDWFIGAIRYNGSLYQNVPLQFDIQNQKVLLEHPVSAKQIELVKEKISSFTLDQRHFISLRDQDVTGLGESHGFYEVLVSGKVMLLCRRTKSLQQKSTAGRIHPIFNEVDKFFLLHDKQIWSVSSKHSASKVFETIDKNAATGVRKKKIRFSGQKELGLGKSVNAFNEFLQ